MCTSEIFTETWSVHLQPVLFKDNTTKTRKLERQFAHLSCNTYFVHCFHLNAYSLLVSNLLHSYYLDSSEFDIVHLSRALAVKVTLQLRVWCKEGLIDAHPPPSLSVGKFITAGDINESSKIPVVCGRANKGKVVFLIPLLKIKKGKVAIKYQS